MSGGHNRRAVRCLDTDKVYESINDAYMATGADPSDIVKVCRGRQKLALKLRWEYMNDNTSS